MLKPSFGFLKKIFSPKTALKPFKAAHKALGPKKVLRAMRPRNPIKAAGRIFGGGGRRSSAPTSSPISRQAAPRTPSPSPSPDSSPSPSPGPSFGSMKRRDRSSMRMRGGY